MVSIELLFWRLVLKGRWNSCLDPEEDNLSSHGHSIDGFRPGADSKKSLSVTLPLETTLIWIIQSSSRGPESRQSPHWRIVKQKLPDCSKNVVKTLIPPQHWKQRRDFLPIGLPNPPVALGYRYLGGKSYLALLHDWHEIPVRKIRLLSHGHRLCGALSSQQKCYHISVSFLSLCSV